MLEAEPCTRQLDGVREELYARLPWLRDSKVKCLDKEVKGLYGREIRGINVKGKTEGTFDEKTKKTRTLP